MARSGCQLWVDNAARARCYTHIQTYVHNKYNTVPTINHNPNTNAESNSNPTCESVYDVWCKS